MKIEGWDSEFWNCQIGRADNVADLDSGGVDCAWLLVSSASPRDIHDAEFVGAEFMDFRVEYGRETGPEVAIARPIIATDIDGLSEVARTAFRGMTRFYADVHFDNDRCDDFYEHWFRENAADRNVEVLMVGDGGGPAGFVTVSVDGDQASIVLIAVAAHARGKGMGENLTRAAVNHAYRIGYPTINVVTQGRNIAAQRAFQAAGFKLQSSAVWLHKWYRK